MKKRFLIFAVLALFFVGCSSDSGGGLAVTEANVLGKWYLEGIKTNNGPLIPYPHSCSTSKDFNEIFANHDIIFTGYDENCDVNDTESNSWTLVGKVFSIVYDDGFTSPEVYQVIKLTDTEMQMKQTSDTDSYVYYLHRL